MNQHALTLLEIESLLGAVEAIDRQKGSLWVMGDFYDSIREIYHVLFDDFSYEKNVNYVIKMINILSLHKLYKEMDSISSDLEGVDNQEHLQHPRWKLATMYAEESLPELKALAERVRSGEKVYFSDS